MVKNDLITRIIPQYKKWRISRIQKSMINIHILIFNIGMPGVPGVKGHRGYTGSDGSKGKKFEVLI